MKGFWGLTKRNLLVFFRDRQTVIFSLLTSIIILALYLLFLKNNYVDTIQGILDSYPGMSDRISSEDIDTFVNLILLNGVAGCAMLTVSYNSLTTVVKDKETRIDYDILATPLKRGWIVLSYFVSAALTSIILTGIILGAGLLIVGLQGDLYLSAADALAAFGTVAFGSISATAFFMILILCFKSTGASGAFFGMLSAASGFVIGAYMPISQFSAGVQTVCNLFPASHVTAILRNALMGGILEHMDGALEGIDGGTFVRTMRDLFSFKAHMFDHALTVRQMALYAAAALVLCLVVQVVLYSKTYKKK